MQSCYKVTSYKAHQLQSLRNVKMHSPCIIQIQSGSKRLYTGNSITNLSSSTYLLCTANESLNFENAPLAGYFQSNVFSFYVAPDENLLSSSRLKQKKLSSGVVARNTCIDITLEALSRYNSNTLSCSSQKLAIKLLYQQLAELGLLHYLFPNHEASFSSKVAQYVAVNPDEDNLIEEIAPKLGLSKSTLIRKLGKEGVRYRDLVAEVRLGMALNLMQEGMDDLQLLAHKCGYASVIRFNQRFKATFGLTLKEYIHSLTA